MDVGSLMRHRDTVTHYISSGSLTMDKRFFAKELLKPESHLRLLMGLDHSQGTKVKEIVKDHEYVHIHYGHGEVVFVPDDVKGYFQKVKEIYKGKIQGCITVAMTYGNMDFLDLTICFE